MSRRLRAEAPPGHSPDPMHVEALWHWLRADVTCPHCHATAENLTRRVAVFQASVNAGAHVADRLWAKDHLDLNEEKLRFPNQTRFRHRERDRRAATAPRMPITADDPARGALLPNMIGERASFSWPASSEVTHFATQGRFRLRACRKARKIVDPRAR